MEKIVYKINFIYIYALEFKILNNGFILNKNKSHIHKNHLSNLLILCDKCHDMVHNDIIKINGYKKSIKGRELVIKKNWKKNILLIPFNWITNPYWK